MLVVSSFSSYRVFADDSEQQDSSETFNDKSDITIDINHDSGIDLEEETQSTFDLPLEDPIDDISDDEGISMFSMASLQSLFIPKILSIDSKGSDAALSIFTSESGSTTMSSISNKAASNADAALIGESANRYKIKIAGLTGWIDKKPYMKPFDPYEVGSMSHYIVSDSGDLIHRLSGGVEKNNYSNINNGKSPNYLIKDAIYYSYDGHYFYTNRVTMLNDYVKGNTANAINNNSPFYNYFQFLPYRTQSSITGEQLDNYLTSVKKFDSLIKDKTGNNTQPNESNMFGAGKIAVDTGTKYGANSLITFAIAVHESGWGQSRIAAQKNNLFGHSAYDSFPAGADGYANVENSFIAHHTNFLNWHYLDVYFKSFEYQGGYLGNKESGMNVRYASDAYWGEKIAAHMLTLDRAYGNKDYAKYKIGMKGNTNIHTNIRMEPSTQSPLVQNKYENYSATLNKSRHSVLILSEVTGEKVGQSNSWYKIAMDSLIDPKTRNLLSIYGENSSGAHVNRHSPYISDVSYGFVHADQISETMYKGAGVVDYGKIPEKPPITYDREDINQDGFILATDYMLIKNHIMDRSKLTGEMLLRADLDGDGHIGASDYMIIKNIIMGR